MNSDVNQITTYVEQLSRPVVSSLLPDLVGLYLHGSLTLDDYVAGASDVDLCAVVREIRDGYRKRLIDAVSPGVLPLKSGGFDLHVVTLDNARNTDWPPVREMWIAAHPGWDFHVEGRAADHDMCLTFEMCRRHGRALYGPDSKEVFAPADRAGLLTAAMREIAEWLSYEQIVNWDSGGLSACRAWWLPEEGELGSKTSAGRWALSKGLPVVERAVEHRAGSRVAIPDQADIRELLRRVHALLEDSPPEGSVAQDG